MKSYHIAHVAPAVKVLSVEQIVPDILGTAVG
jgi:hypothetical protein